MFYLVGIGLKPEHLTLEAQNALKECSEIYIEQYTSQYSEGSIEFLEALLGRKIIMTDRHEVETKFKEKLEFSKSQNIALLVFGNPLTATTHIQLILDCQQIKTPYAVIPGISITNFIGHTGLQEYKFGRAVTIVLPEKNYSPESFFDLLRENQKLGLHSLCLLDIKREKKKLMSIKEAITVLEEIGEKRKDSLLKGAILVGIAGAGSAKMQLKAGSARRLKTFGFNEFPQCMIVCGALSEKEHEALQTLAGLKE
ncbi:MAG: diphthine synthase [Candidatus Diapherotrites archaeon]|nr:diphthine synthase [Candidatus Diapherotrites archaeon]